MNALNSLTRIRELMSLFVTNAKAASATGKTDLNQVSETVLIPLFKEVYGYSHLENLNKTERKNFPGIDLGDKVAGVAFQITGSADSEKVKDTLRTFVAHDLYRTYSRLIIYIITEKQKSYSGSGYEDIIQGRFKFDKENDILDFRDILRQVEHFQIDKLRRIENILEANLSDRRVPLFGVNSATRNEPVFLNLLEVSFPQTLFIADMCLDERGDEKQLARQDRRPWQARKGRFVSARGQIWAALRDKGERFSSDWEFYNGKIFTFHNLEDPNVALRSIIDVGTIEPIRAQEFYSIDENYERAFKSLLRCCLQQKLYQHRVIWQHEEHKFIFADLNGEISRRESWVGKIETDREVYVRTMKNNKPDEILKCKHLAFEVQFRSFGSNWYAIITPDWFFSFDGYRKNSFCEDDIKWLKRKENNQHVAYHAMFIAYFLKREALPEKPQTIDMFESELSAVPEQERQPYPYLTFGEYVTFDNAPYLPDNLWRPVKKEDDQEDHQMAFEL